MHERCLIIYSGPHKRPIQLKIIRVINTRDTWKRTAPASGLYAKISFRYDLDTWTVDRFLLSIPVSIYGTHHFFLQTRSTAISYTLIYQNKLSISSLFIVENVVLWWKLWMRLWLQVRKWLWRVSNR